MRYRKLSPTGDYTFGQGLANFWIDVPQAPAQAARTRLLLITGEWFLDVTDGTNYPGKILGFGTRGTRDLEIKSRILGTPGVTELTAYVSNVQKRNFAPFAAFNTVYGPAAIEVPTP